MIFDFVLLAYFFFSQRKGKKGAVHRIFQSRRLSGGSARSPEPRGKPDSRSYLRNARDGRNAENSHTVLYGTFVTSVTRREVVNFDEALSVASVTAAANKPFLHLKAVTVHLLLECFCRNVKIGRRTEKTCELRIAPSKVFLLPHEGKQFSDHIGEKQFGRVKTVAYRFPCVNLLFRWQKALICLLLLL